MEERRESLHNGSGGFYVILGALAVYFIQNFIHLPSVLGQGMLLLALGMALICMARTLFDSRRPMMLDVAALMLFMIWIMWAVSEREVRSAPLGVLSTSVMLKNSSVFFLMLFAGYISGRRHLFTSRDYLVACLTVLGVAVIHFILCIRMLAAANISDNVNNGAYCFVSVLPFIVAIMKDYRKTGLTVFAICFIFILISGKRGAMLCMGASLIYYYVNYLSGDKSGRVQKILALSAVTLCFLMVLILEYAQNEYFRQRVEMTVNGYSSGRDTIYGVLLTALMDETDSVHILFGRGLMQTVNIAENYAHSDWLELAVDCGMVAIVLYVLFFVSFMGFVARKKRVAPSRMIFNMKFIMLLLFIKSIFSMGCIAIFNGFDMLLLGMLCGNVAGMRRKYKGGRIKYNKDKV